MVNITASPQELSTDSIVALLLDKKAMDVCVFDVSSIFSWSDYLIIAEAISSRHMRILSALIYKHIKASSVYLPIASGSESDGFMVVDAGSIVVYLMTQTVRKAYALESLWEERGAKRIAIC